MVVMKITLLNHTHNPETVCALAMRRCYSALPMEKLEEELREKGLDYIKYLMNRVKEDKSFDIWEHAIFTFEIEGVSRALTHQLIRHRMASYDQESQRFAPSPMDYITPPSIKGTIWEPEFHSVAQRCWQLYKDMIEHGKLPKQDARYILPNAAETKLVMTLNARSLMHLLYMRTAAGAQWEIKDLANKLYEIVKPLAPNIFAEIIQC